MTAVHDSRLTASQAARVAGVAPETIRLWVKTGRLRAERTPLGMLIDPHDLDAVIREREQPPLRRTRGA